MSACGRPTFAGHHGSRFEALLARTFETSHHVGAGSVSTGVPDGALIGVWAGPGTDSQTDVLLHGVNQRSTSFSFDEAG